MVAFVRSHFLAPPTLSKNDLKNQVSSDFTSSRKSEKTDNPDSDKTESPYTYSN